MSSADLPWQKQVSRCQSRCLKAGQDQAEKDGADHGFPGMCPDGLAVWITC